MDKEVRPDLFVFFIRFLYNIPGENRQAGCSGRKNPMVQLRKLNDADRAAIRAWPPYPADMAQMDYALREKGWFFEFDSRSDVFYYAVLDGEKLIGFTLLAKTGPAEAEFRIAIHPDHTGLGLGKSIIRETLRNGFETLRLTQISLIVRKNNLRGIRLYRKVGFQDRGDCQKMIQGAPVDFWLMAITPADHERNKPG